MPPIILLTISMAYARLQECNIVTSRIYVFCWYDVEEYTESIIRNEA